MNINKWLKNNTKNLSGKRVVVTGATGGLGKELCMYLAGLNASLVLACRNENLALDLKKQIINKYPNVMIDFVSLDLSSMQSVNECIDKLQKFDRIDILIHNAGVYNVPVKKLETGFNNIFQINFVSPYYLTKELLPLLKKSKEPMCMVVGSIAHNYSKTSSSDIDFSFSKKPSKIYGNSKRYLMFSMFELFKNENNISFSVAHPGITLTNMTNHYPKFINWFVKIGIKLIFPAPKKATLNLVKGIFTPCNYHEWVGPKFLNIWGRPKKQKLNTCSTEESLDIYNKSEEIYKKLKYK